MKKIILLLLVSFSLAHVVKAQCPGCLVDLACSISPAAPTLCPAVLPDGTQNNAYDQNVTFYMPAQFTTQGINVTLNKITINNISGMPPGLSWQTNSASNEFFPSSNPPTSERGCVKICGNPTGIGQFNIIVAVTAEVNTPIGNISQNSSFTLPVYIAPPAGANSSFAYNPAFGCAPLDVNFEATMTAQPLEIIAYDWNFDNGNTSTAMLPPAQNYAVADTYYVSLVTKKYAYRISSVTILATGTAWCGDVEEPNLFGCVGSPDLFFEFSNNSATQSVASVADQMSATFSNLNYVITDPAFSFQFWDEDLISANDDLGLFAGTITGVGTFNLSTSQISGTYIVDTVFTQQFSDIDTVIVYPSPQIPVLTAIGTTTFCQGDSVILQVPALGNSYQWYTNDTTLIIGSTNNELHINSSGSYSVVETNPFGCSALSAAQAVTVYPLPASPNLTLNGGEITSSANGNLQWLYNGQALPGQTLSNLLYGDTGVYTLTITTANGCVNSSSMHITTPSGIGSVNSNYHITVFPNPANEFIMVTAQMAHNKPVSIAITDVRGMLIKNFNNVLIPQDGIQLNVNELTNGIYFIQISNKEMRFQQKIAILK